MVEKLPLIPVILCGGTGSRLWPLSREMYPKPFIRMANGSTLFEDTLGRADFVCGGKAPLIVGNEEHRFYILEAMQKMGVKGRILLEPAPRNTAPALTMAALSMTVSGEDPLMLVMPADHYFADRETFRETIARARPRAESGQIVTFGITPSRPEPGYGYIEQGGQIDGSCFHVTRFVEKPQPADAEKMLASGKYFWNSGIFMLPASLYLKEMEKYAPDILLACQKAWAKRQEDGDFVHIDRDAFLEAPENSIDYAIMEKTDRASMIPMQCGWSDMGAWDSFYHAGGRAGNGNVHVGDVILEDVENSYIHAQDRLVAAVGLKDMVIVESRDAVLVVPRERAQEVKKIVKTLKEGEREEFRLHPLVYRPWGSYERIAKGNRFQVKRIIVRPGGSLSLQMHYHRAEHWIVVSGTAEITVGDKQSLYTENQSIYIPVGSTHKLHNPGHIPLELIEVQTGSYLGEDDIVRLDDKYGRA